MILRSTQLPTPPRGIPQKPLALCIAMVAVAFPHCVPLQCHGSEEEVAQVYSTKIKPFLRERCYGCHGALKQEANLRLDTVESMLKGGDSGEAISPGNDASLSLLLERVSTDDLSIRMPPEHEGEAFTTAQIEMFKEWIKSGADSEGDEVPEKSPSEHWSFKPLIRPALPSIGPTVHSTAEPGAASQQQPKKPWVRNSIDLFIEAGHREQSLSPQPEASRELLLRRLTVDLIGILPTAAEIDAFEQDDSPDWYEKAVERLLDDPRHGERWARHWMDNWRYSDWWGLGEELRNSQRHVWHWRDWIIESLNQDTPYDEMVRLMIAADEIAPTELESLRAGGYLARNYFIFNRTQWLDGAIEHVGKGFLGLTMNCAKCHDHKFDPISQSDYYRMRAFFEPYHIRVDMVPGQTNTKLDGVPRPFDGELHTPTYLFVRGDEAQPDQSKVIAPGVPEIFSEVPFAIQPVDLPSAAFEPERQPWVASAYLADAERSLQAAQSEHQTAKSKLDDARTYLHEAHSDIQSTDVLPPPYVSDFSNLDSARWRMLSGNWKQNPDSLTQTTDGATRSALRYLGSIPENFDATLQLKILGGSQWRSIGIAFDCVEDEGNSSEVLVYVSGVSGGAKVQASFMQNGTSQYPPQAAKPMEIAIDRDYTLQVQIRGNLLNVFLDGERVVSWRSPIARRQGGMQLITFDAIASIKSFQIVGLDPQVGLIDPETQQMTYGDKRREAQHQVEQWEQAEHIASMKLKVQQTAFASCKARVEAFQLKWNQTDAGTYERAHFDAVRAERKLNWKKSQLEVAQLQRALDTASESEKAVAQQKLESARKAEEQFKLKCESTPTLADLITPFSGAQWSPTRFKSTGADDPAISYPSTSSGRRRALAEWITSPKNPLTARVAVNHIWSRHLDQPLAANTFDFGRNAAEPANPELLDWLAAELVDNGWSMKHIHRLIVNSATYRMTSSVAGGEEKLKADPDNRFWWRRTPIRLESQVIRDSILAMSGRLDPTIGGPPVLPADQDRSRRRSLYFFHSNNDRNLFLTTFDEAMVAECYRREQSIVPQQALALPNSALVLDGALEIAKKIAEDVSSNDDFVRSSFKTILGITANKDEANLAIEAMEEWQKLPDMTLEQARANLVWSLLNHNDFVTLR